MKLTLLAVLGILSCSVQAEVYRWTDSAGKVHYSDKKPAEKAENISSKIKQQNIDTSTAEREKLETIFRKENDADRAYKRQQSQKPLAEIRQCQEAREYLKVIDGRVQFLDENGGMVKVTEEERRAKVQETQDFIAQNCSD